LGKHIWQNRWFRLEQTPDYMHSRLVYTKEKGSEKGSESEGNIPLSTIKCVTLLENKKEGRLDIELKGGMIEEQRMLALLATDEGKAKEWRDALTRLLSLLQAHTPTHSENKFWYSTPDIVQSDIVKPKKIVKKEKDPSVMEERKHVHFQDEIPNVDSRPQALAPARRESGVKEDGLDSSSERNRTSVSPSKDEPDIQRSSTQHILSSSRADGVNPVGPVKSTSTTVSIPAAAIPTSADPPAVGFIGPFRPLPSGHIPPYISSVHTAIPPGIHTTLSSGALNTTGQRSGEIRASVTLAKPPPPNGVRTTTTSGSLSVVSTT